MRWGLNVKFICYTVFIVVFISLVFSIVFIYQSRRALLEEFRRTGESLVQNLARNSEIPLLLENVPALTALARNLLQERGVQQVVIADQSGRRLVEIGKQRRLLPWQQERISGLVSFTPESDAADGQGMSLFLGEHGQAPAGPMPGGQVLGTVEVLFSREAIIRTLNRMRWWIFVAATIAAIIGGGGALYFSRTLIRPIQRLAAATYSIARGNWQERLEVQRSDELGRLTESFNIMAASLEDNRTQLETTYRELARQEKMAETGKFSMIIAHELKNPLGIIKGSVDILAKETTSPDMRETMIGYIREEVMRLNKLIEDFLSFARPMPLQQITADINDVAGKVAEHVTLSGGLPDGICLKLDLQAATPVRIDENQIYQALLNLVGNAIQALESGGTIMLATREDGPDTVVTVQDTGAGIPAGDVERIFEPFFTTKATGTGLGLAIVKKVVETHRGTITAAAGRPQGAIFSIRLPRQAGNGGTVDA